MQTDMSYINFLGTAILGYFTYSLVMFIIFLRKCERVGAKNELPGFLMVALIYPIFFAQIVLIYGKYVDRFSSLSLILAPAAVWLAAVALTKDPIFQACHDLKLDETKRSAYRKSRDRSFAVYFLSLAVMVLCVAANMSQTVSRNSPVKTITGRVNVYVLFDNRFFSIQPEDNGAKKRHFYCGRGRKTVCRPDTQGVYPENEVWTVSYVTSPDDYRAYGPNPDDTAGFAYAIAVAAENKVLRTAKEGWDLYTRSRLYDGIALLTALLATISLSTYFRKPK